MSEKLKDDLFLYTVIFLVGGCLYSTVEIVYRQYTHVSMFFAGGICLVVIALIDTLTPGVRFIFKPILCGLAITAVELIFGLILNVALGMSVWNYSSEPLNLFGQVCLLFSVLWVIISIPALLLARLTRLLLVKAQIEQ